MILEKIKEANDVKQLSLSECEQLAQEIRDFLIRSLSETGGHLASNLGVVELTIALHRFLHFPEDKLVWLALIDRNLKAQSPFFFCKIDGEIRNSVHGAVLQLFR